MLVDIIAKDFEAAVQVIVEHGVELTIYERQAMSFGNL
jgi:hypothetical protein